MRNHGLRTTAFWQVVIAALVSAGCSGATRHGNGTDSNNDAQAGAAGAVGVGAMNAGAAGTGDEDQPAMGPNELERLLACVVEEPCGRSNAQLVEGATRNFSKLAAKCVLEGLRDRKPGRYLHDTDSTTSGSSDGAHHVVLITDAGQVLHAAEDYSYGPVAQGEPVIAGQRCQLKPASYFESCLSALDGSAATDADTAWQCVFGPSVGIAPGQIPWFESCSSEVGLACQ